MTATILGRFDVNKNGRLELQEASSLGIPAGRIDADRDGELSRDELHTYLSQLQDEIGDLADGLPGWFYELDSNRDQQVAMAEFTEEWTDAKIQEFASLDHNADGLLTAHEVMQSKAMVGGSYNNTNADVLPPRKTIISEIVISEDYPIGDLNVQLSITHSHTSYLDAYLTGPDGQRVELFTEVGGSDDHFDQTILDDQSRFPITKARPPFKGTFLPEAVLKRQPGLSQFNGKSVQGVWQLIVRGTRSDRFGMLHSWGLIVKPQEEMIGPVAAPALDGPRESSITLSSLGQPEPRSENIRADIESVRSAAEAKAQATADAKRAFYERLKARGVKKSEQELGDTSDGPDEREAMIEARKRVIGEYKEFLKKKK